MTYASSGRYDDAIKEFQRALDLDSLNPDAYRELGRTYERIHKDDEAEATYKRAIELRPSDWLSVSGLGQFYYRHGRNAEAEPYLRRIVDLTPDNTNGYNNLGGLYLVMGRYDEAEPLLKKSIQLKPNDGGYSNLGTLYFARGQYDEAVRMFERAIDLGTGTNYIVFGNLADSYRWAPGLASKALAAYNHAIELADQQLAVNPKNAAVLSSIALYYVKSGRKDIALGDIARAREVAPTDTTVAFKAAVVFELSGRRDDALTMINDLLKKGFSLDQIQGEPELAGLRQDPRFTRIVSETSGVDPHIKTR
jgi:serine/threonine-protein kinase